MARHSLLSGTTFYSNVLLYISIVLLLIIYIIEIGNTTFIKYPPIWLLRALAAGGSLVTIGLSMVVGIILYNKYNHITDTRSSMAQLLNPFYGSGGVYGSHERNGHPYFYNGAGDKNYDASSFLPRF